jgi:hypothetical protein
MLLALVHNIMILLPIRELFYRAYLTPLFSSS